MLAGLVVLSTLLAAVTVARGRFLRQWSQADRRLAAIHAADALLAHWLQTPTTPFPVPDSGAFDSAPGFAWRTSRVFSPAADDLDADVVRLEVFDAPRPGGSAAVFTLDFLRRRVSRQQPAKPAAPSRVFLPRGS